MMRSVLLGLILWAGTSFAQPTKIQSAEALVFGPDGILFVGDSIGGAVIALDTGDRTSVSASFTSMEGIDRKIAAFLGTKPTEVRFNDIKVNPLSKNIYLAISRGRGPGAIPVILRLDAKTGTFTELDTEHMPSTRVTLQGLPTSRRLVITELQYSTGQLIVAGLSNENFSSTLRVIPFPFKPGPGNKGASIEIYHTSHFAYETNAPVRTMVPYISNGERFLLAAYTCTPLVKLRMSDLKDGAHITGETLAELGRHSSPVDMILYQRGGQDFLLVANTLHGVMRLSLNGFADFSAVNEDGGDDAQIPTQKMALRGVVQLDSYDETRALMLFDAKDRLDLRLVPLP